MFLSKSEDVHDIFAAILRLIFVTFFKVRGLKHLNTGYLVNATPPTVYAGSV